MRTAHHILAISTILVSLAAVPAGAQIAIDPTAASGSNLGISVSWMHTVGNAPNRLLVVGVASATANPFPTATSVTYGGQPLTRQVVSTQLGAPNIEIWTLVAPPNGTAQIIATFPQSTTIAGGSVSFSGVDQGTPIRATNNARALGIGVTVATSVTTNIGDVMIDAVAAAGTSASGSPAIGQTLQWSGSTSGTLFGGGSTKPGAAGTTIMSWNLSGGSPSVSGDIAAISLMPATVSNGPTVTPLPPTLLLVCMGLAALAVWNQRRLFRLGL